MTNSAWNKLQEALQHMDLLRISHPEAEFNETKSTALNIVLSNELQTLKTLKKGFQKYIQKKKPPTLRERLDANGYVNLKPITPEIQTGFYEGEYFISEPIAGFIRITGYAVVDESGCLRVYFSGSISEKESEYAITHQIEMTKAMQSFATACANYAAEHNLKRIVYAAYSRSSEPIAALGVSELIPFCEQRNIEIDFFPIAALEPVKEVKEQIEFTAEVAPIRLACDIACPDKNIASNNKSTKQRIPSYTISSQYFTETYNDIGTYLSNLNHYIHNHGLANYRRHLSELANPFYQTFLEQVKEPCRIHYIRESGAADDIVNVKAEAILQADAHQLNVILPYSGTVQVKSSDRKSQIFYFDHPSEAEKVIFDTYDDVTVVVTGNAQEYTVLYDKLPDNSIEMVVYEKASEAIVGTFVNADEVAFNNSCAKWRDDRLVFSSPQRTLPERMAFCAKSLHSTSERQKIPVSEAILIKH